MSTGLPGRLRGALRSPIERILSLRPHAAAVGIPSSYGIVPPRLSYWGNQSYGICTTAEEAFAKACYSIMRGLAETYMPEPTVIEWARQRGYLWGATLLEVMRDMRSDGMRDERNDLYHDGLPESVNWTDEGTLRSAIYRGPVKIGVAADQLYRVVGSSNGWFSGNFAVDRNMDHCVSLSGYGTVAELYEILDMRIPSSADPGEDAHFMFTWSTVGVITARSMRNITAEAYVRNPTTPEQEQQTNPTPTAIVLSSSPNPSVKDEPVTLSAKVTGQGTTPTGNVTFSDGGTAFSTTPLSGDTAKTVTPYFGVGVHHLTAKYNGDPANLASSSATYYQTVNEAAPGPDPEPQPPSGVTVTYDPTTNTVIIGGVTVKGS